jgi:hypothetical protein
VMLLRDPTFTFTILGMLHLVAIATHWTYRHFTPFVNAPKFIGSHFLTPIGAHDIPPPIILWVMGAIGLAAHFAGGAQTGDAGGKLLNGLTFMLWMPFLIPHYQQIVGAKYADQKKHIPFIGIFAIIIAACAMVVNQRQLMLTGPVQYAVIHLIFLLSKPHFVTKSFIQRISIAALAAILMVNVLSDIATAMVVVRSKRATATAQEMFDETYKAFIDKDGLARYREQGDMAAKTNLYDEAYLHNPLLSRFSETKYHDNMLYFASSMNDIDRTEIIDLTINRTILLLPQFAIDFLRINLDKNQYFYSMGDVYINLHHGAAKGSYVIGSIWADLYAIFGLLMPFACAGLLLITFVIFDSMTRFDRPYYISPAALCTSWPIFLFGIGGESIAGKAGLLFREIPQRIILYCATYALISAMLKITARKAAPTKYTS